MIHKDKRQQAEAAMAFLVNEHRHVLRRKGAVDMIAGSEYVAFVLARKTEDGQYIVNIKSWGADHGNRTGFDLDALLKQIHEDYDL